MSTWIILVSKDFRQNFERALQARLWDMRIQTHNPPMSPGDLLYFWVTGGGEDGGLVGAAEIVDGPRGILSSDTRPWVAEDATDYKYRVLLDRIRRIQHPGFPAGELMEQIGTGRLNPATRVPASAAEWIAQQIAGYESPEAETAAQELAREWQEPEAGTRSVSELEEDLRTRIAASIVARQGQGSFRADLLENYGRRCAISGSEVVDVLDAAHIMPYRGHQTDIQENGILLRTDLHTLFDKHLLTIRDGRVLLAPQLQRTDYAQFAGVKVRRPDRGRPPSDVYLKEHRRLCAEWLPSSD